MVKHINPGPKAWGYRQHYSSYGIGFALVVLVIGLYWLSKDMGWIQTDVSIWPILLIVLGTYWILKAIVFKILSIKR